MDSTDLHELIDADPRPAFIVDLSSRHPGQTLHIAFCNQAFRVQKGLLKTILADSPESVELRAWITIPNTRGSTHVAGDTEWFEYGVRGRWRVLQAVRQQKESSIFAQLAHKTSDASLEDGDAVITNEHGHSALDADPLTFAPWQAGDAVPSHLDAHLELIRTFDWANTSMGPLHTWPSELLHIIHIMLLENQPRLVLLGKDNLMLYNEAYAPLLGERHPLVLGMSLLEAWGEASEIIIRDLTKLEETGRPLVRDDFSICLNRNGYLEQMEFSWTIIPLAKPLVGYYVNSMETTHRRIAERRKAALGALANACGGLRNMQDFWRAAVQSLELNERDCPLGFLYTQQVRPGEDTPQVSLARQTQKSESRLEGIFGCTEPGMLLPSVLDLDANSEGFAPIFRQVLSQGKPRTLKLEDGTLPQAVVDYAQPRAFGDVCKSAIAYPLRGPQGATLGILTIGLNTRRPYDDEYQLWIGRLVRTLQELAVSTFAAEEQDHIAKEAKAKSASAREVLAEALATSTLEASETTSKLQRLLRVMSMVDVGIFEYSPTGKLLQANDAFFHLSGHPKDVNAAEFSFMECVHEDDVPNVLAQWNKLVQGIPATFEHRWKWTDDNFDDTDEEGLWVLAAYVPVVDENGNLISISGVITDISAQKQSQKAANDRLDLMERAKTSERRFAHFTRMSPVAICFLSPKPSATESVLQYANEKWYTTTGHPRVSSGEVNWENIVYEEDISIVQEGWTTLLSEKRPVDFQFRLKRKWTAPDGSIDHAWVLGLTYPEINEDGEIPTVVSIMTEISHLKWSERVQGDRIVEAMEAKRQQENFIDMTCHEIRNPLSAVVHCADSIVTSLSEMKSIMRLTLPHLQPADQKLLVDTFQSSSDSVNTIISCSVHQKRIVDDILTLSKLDSSLVQITSWPTRPVAILEDVMKMFEVDAQKVGVNLGVLRDKSLDEVKADWMMLDPGRLMQILINLITNAIKFTQTETKREVTVRMGASSQPPTEETVLVNFVPRSSSRLVEPTLSIDDSGDHVYLYFVVQDSGCGLSVEEKAKIFARFTQGSPKTYTKYGGSGLGLFISRELTELQGGRIGVASTAGVGSTFAFFVKSQRAVAPPPAQADNWLVDSNAAQKTVPGRRKSALQRYSILVVEDNVVNQKVLSMQLRKLGHEVHVASHGGEALQFLQRTRHWHDNSASNTELSVILMDWEMPVMDGLTCAVEIRKLQRQGMLHGDLPIIAVSANARGEQIDHALSCGMNEHIAKPFRIVDELIPKIAKLVKWDNAGS